MYVGKVDVLDFINVILLISSCTSLSMVTLISASRSFSPSWFAAISINFSFPSIR